MKNEQWAAIHTVFEKVETLAKKLRPPAREGGALEPLSGLIGDPSTPTSGELASEIVRVRADIRTQLDFLRVKLAESLMERECYLVLFPLVIYFDELVQSRYLYDGKSWPPLQVELFQIDDGGDLFFTMLDDILAKPQTLPFIFEIYYLCLNHGFKGRYSGNPVKLNEYLKKLRDKIPVIDIEAMKSEADNLSTASSEPFRWFRSSLWYYGAAIAIVIVVYFILRFYAIYDHF